MNDMFIYCAAAVAGLLLGILFLGGLWWTTRRGIGSTQPALWFIGSLLCRTVMMLAGFYYVSGGDWHRLVACLAGFIIARVAVLRIASPSSFSQYRQGSST